VYGDKKQLNIMYIQLSNEYNPISSKLFQVERYLRRKWVSNNEKDKGGKWMNPQTEHFVLHEGRTYACIFEIITGPREKMDGKYKTYLS
jgi:hypothetical protein